MFFIIAYLSALSSNFYIDKKAPPRTIKCKAELLIPDLISKPIFPLDFGILSPIQISDRRKDLHLPSDRIGTVLLVSSLGINAGLLSLTILEELGCNLREQSIGKSILILLLVRCNGLLHLRKLRL